LLGRSNSIGRFAPDLDLAFWLPSLEADGGPPLASMLRDAPELAAWVAGYFFSRAVFPPIPDALYVRPPQLVPVANRAAVGGARAGAAAALTER
jgi:hypothetical protein